MKYSKNHIFVCRVCQEMNRHRPTSHIGVFNYEEYRSHIVHIHGMHKEVVNLIIDKSAVYDVSLKENKEVYDAYKRRREMGREFFNK